MCTKKFLSSVKKNRFREETHYLLDYYTLKIKDPEVDKQYEKLRIGRSNEIFTPLGFLCLCFLIGGIVGSLANFSSSINRLNAAIGCAL
jgi:hypothetical protein